jgi:signal transduction histidine kinase/DNA-binding response OmpR family regulator/HPt (histidine-containing phosphotransfer) domain-containing protein
MLSLSRYKLRKGLLSEVLLVLLILVGVHQTTHYSYLLFHSIAELFSIFISVTVFIIAINCWESIRNQYLLFIGIANLFIGLIDLLHTLSYNGLGIFIDYDYYAPQFWIAGRYLESISLLLAFSVLGAKKHINKSLVFSGYFLTTSILIAAILYFKNFPICFVAGEGLTKFKIISEYVVCVILSLNILFLYRLKQHFQPRVYQLIFTSLLFMMIMELCFTQYVTDTMSDMYNEIGHLFKIIAFYLIYKALVVTGIRDPINLLFRDLHISQQQLLEAQAIAKLGRWEWQLPNGTWLCTNEIYRILDLPLNTPICTETFLSKLKASSREDFQNLLVRISYTDQPFELSLTLDNQEACHFAHLHGEVFRNKQGQVEKLVGTMQDVTTQQQMMEALQYAKQAADSANAAKSIFLANMSHEIRTPINAIIGMQYLALKTELTPNQLNYLSKAQGAAKALLGIVNDILDFSKIEAGKMEIESIEFCLDSVLGQLADSLGFQAEQKGIEFLISYTPNLPYMLIGDPLRLGQVLLNLCSNAIKFTEKGEVEVSLTRLNSTESKLTLQISVRDTGIGMTREVQSHLFQKFSQADQATTRVFGGTGLGLAICKHLTELMGGRIWIEDSQPGNGTTICCTIQCQIAEKFEHSRREREECVIPLLKGMSALVVDDNKASQQIITDLLHTFHIDTVVASDGKTALELLKNASEKPIDMVLMDWRMPGMNGDEVTMRIHADPDIKPQPKIIMITAYGREDVIRLSEQAKVDGFLLKPVSPSQLLDAIMSFRGGDLTANLRNMGWNENKAQTRYNFSGTHLLLVEDNELNREFATELLHSVNIEVDIATNGEEALNRVRQHVYDAVLMDIQMPLMDGWEATRCIRALAKQQDSDYFAQLPIIAMSALAMSQDTEISHQVGMNDHITKPILPEKLMETLAKWLKMSNMPTEVKLSKETKTELLPVYLSKLLALKRIDAKQGIHRIGGNAEAYLKQLNRFRERYPTAIDDLVQLIKEKGCREAEEYCHALKGVFGNLGANELFMAIDAVDKLLKQEQTPAPQQLEYLRVLLNQTMSEIDNLVASICVQPRETVLLGNDQLMIKLKALAYLLENDFGAAELLLNEVRAGVVDSVIAQAIAEIAVKIDVCAIDEALTKISMLLNQLSSIITATESKSN